MKLFADNYVDQLAQEWIVAKGAQSRRIGERLTGQELFCQLHCCRAGSMAVAFDEVVAVWGGNVDPTSNEAVVQILHKVAYLCGLRHIFTSAAKKTSHVLGKHGTQLHMIIVLIE